MIFTAYPSVKDEGEYSIYVKFTDDNKEPMSNEFSFLLYVSDPNKLIFLQKEKIVEKKKQIIIEEKIKVFIVPPD